MRAAYSLYKTTYTDRTTGQQRESDTWHIRFRDHLRRRQRITGTTRERETIALAENIVELVRVRSSGTTIDGKLGRWVSRLPEDLRARLTAMDLLDAAVNPSTKPLALLLKGEFDDDGKLIFPGWQQSLEASGGTEKHVDVEVTRVEQILLNCAFSYFRDLMAPGAVTRIEVWLGDRRQSGEIGGTTYNKFVRAIKSFCRWMAKDSLVPAVALIGLDEVDNADADKKQRRALTPEEMRCLINAAETGRAHSGMTGRERAIVYRFGFETGIRPQQMRSLTVANFDLDSQPATVTSHARYVKRRKKHVQILTAAMAAKLREEFATKLPTTAAFKFGSKYHLARMLRKDLAAAKVAWIEAAGEDGTERAKRIKSEFLEAINRQGEKAVFYSLRHGHGTALADAGVPEKDIARSMHHASRTTTQRYIHTDLSTLATTIQQLPDLSEPNKAIRTGTTDAPVDAVLDPMLDQCLSNACPPQRRLAEIGGVIDIKASLAEDEARTGITPKSAVSSFLASWRNWQTQWIQNKRRPLEKPRKTKQIRSRSRSLYKRFTNRCV